MYRIRRNGTLFFGTAYGTNSDFQAILKARRRDNKCPCSVIVPDGVDSTILFEFAINTRRNVKSVDLTIGFPVQDPLTVSVISCRGNNTGFGFSADTAGTNLFTVAVTRHNGDRPLAEGVVAS